MEVLDTTLVWTNMRDSNLLHFYGLGSKKLLGAIIDRGNKKKECLNISDILLTNDPGVFWTYDITLGKFVKVDLNAFLRLRDEYSPSEYFSLDTNLRGTKSPNWLSDSLFSSCSYSIEDCRFLKFNSRSQIQEKVGKLPLPDPKWPKGYPKAKLNLRAYAYKANLKKHPNENRYIVSYLTSGRIEIYANDTLNRTILGPEEIKPIYDFKKIGKMVLPSDNPKTKQTNISIKVTDKRIYILYSGQDTFKYGGERILVFDWKGNPLEDLRLPRACVYFCVQEVSEESVNIFLVDRATRNVILSKIKIKNI